jgi:hypothetical protein
MQNHDNFVDLFQGDRSSSGANEVPCTSSTRGSGGISWARDFGKSKTNRQMNTNCVSKIPTSEQNANLFLEEIIIYYV